MWKWDGGRLDLRIAGEGEPDELSPYNLCGFCPHQNCLSVCFANMGPLHNLARRFGRLPPAHVACNAAAW